MNIIDHEEDDTVSFNVKDTWYFNKEESGSLTGKEIITIPHVVILVSILLIIIHRIGGPTSFNPDLVVPSSFLMSWRSSSGRCIVPSDVD